MGKVDDELLQRYFDDTLVDAERERVEADLTDEDRERLAALAEMRGLLARTLEAEAGEIDLLPALEPRLKGRRGRLHRWTGGVTSFGLAVAAVAALLLVMRPWQSRLPTNECDVETLEVDGSLASVFRVKDGAHGGDATTTIIWAEEQ
jgi:anti-sigma factor RsiW